MIENLEVLCIEYRETSVFVRFLGFRMAKPYHSFISLVGNFSVFSRKYLSLPPIIARQEQTRDDVHSAGFGASVVSGDLFSDFPRIASSNSFIVGCRGVLPLEGFKLLVEPFFLGVGFLLGGPLDWSFLLNP